MIDADGRNERRLTQTPSVDEDGPRYSGDGKRIVYAHDGRIDYMAADGSDARALGAGASADRR